MANSYQFDPKWMKRNKTKGQTFKMVGMPGVFTGYQHLLNKLQEKPKEDSEITRKTKDAKSVCI